MSRRRRLPAGRAALVLAAALAGRVAAAQPVDPPCVPCLRWEVTPAQAQHLAGTGVALEGLELLLDGEPEDAAALVSALRDRGARVGQRLPESRATAADSQAEAVVIALDPAVAMSADQRAFRIKAAATHLRGVAPAMRVGLEGPPELVRALWSHGLGGYVDFVVTGPAPSQEAPDVERWVRLGASASLREVLAASAGVSGGRVLARWPGPGSSGDAPLALHRAGAVLGAALVPLPGVAVDCLAGGGKAACAAGAFQHGNGAALVLLFADAPLDAVRLRVLEGDAPPPPGRQPAVLHALSSAVAPAAVEGESDERSTLIPLGGAAGAWLLELPGWAGAQGRFGAGVDVVAGRALTLQEILARHQAWSARQRRLVPRVVSWGSLVIAFQAPGLAGPMTVTSDVVLYVDGGITDMEQRAIRLNGLALDGGDVPRLPIVEPERVAAAPLALRLDDAYRYALHGREPAGGHDCYRVDFSPAGGGASFRGQAWLHARDFALVRMRAEQTGLRGPVVSSQQTDEFAPVPHAGATVWLLARSTAHQVYEGPGHRTPIDRRLVLHRHQPAPDDFDARLAAAHASSSVIVRDGPDGAHYLRRRPPAEGPGPRQAAGKAAAVRTLALGLLVDPNIGDPLPFAGAGYTDFDLLGSGTQLSAFLAGAFAQVSWSAPAVRGGRWGLQASAFASLVAYNDRVFRQGIERYEENLRQRPVRMGVDLTRPLGGPWRLRAGYELDAVLLERSELTAAAFRAPPDAIAHAVRLELSGHRGAWSGSAWWRPAWRQGWRTWGLPENDEGTPPRGSYQRYGLTLGRTVLASPRTQARLEVAAMSGRGLDRFSRFAFDAYQNRLTGYPSASVRYDRGVVVRTSFHWRAGPWARGQAFADAAHVRDAGFGARGRTLGGLGAGLELVLPWKTLLAAEWGWGPQGLDRDGGRGTHTLRLTAYRVF